MFPAIMGEDLGLWALTLNEPCLPQFAGRTLSRAVAPCPSWGSSSPLPPKEEKGLHKQGPGEVCL